MSSPVLVHTCDWVMWLLWDPCSCGKSNMFISSSFNFNSHGTLASVFFSVVFTSCNATFCFQENLLGQLFIITNCPSPGKAQIIYYCRELPKNRATKKEFFSVMSNHFALSSCVTPLDFS